MSPSPKGATSFVSSTLFAGRSGLPKSLTPLKYTDMDYDTAPQEPSLPSTYTSCDTTVQGVLMTRGQTTLVPQSASDGVARLRDDWVTAAKNRQRRNKDLKNTGNIPTTFTQGSIAAVKRNRTNYCPAGATPRQHGFAIKRARSFANAARMDLYLAILDKDQKKEDQVVTIKRSITQSWKDISSWGSAPLFEAAGLVEGYFR